MTEETIAVSYEPHIIGPTWQKTADGGWLLPKHTLGWQIVEWCGDYLRALDDDAPWTFTLEQLRLVLHMYAVDESGRFLYRDMVIQRSKGWGKDPLAAVLSIVEWLGPCRFSHWDPRTGEPVAREERNAWVQIAAVSAEQTKNTGALLPALVTDRLKADYGIELNKEKSYAMGGTRRIEIVSSSSRTLEGNRPTYVVRNEVHHWMRSNGGYDPDGMEQGNSLAGVIFRNLGKIKGGQARGISITNAYNPSEQSYGRKQREEYLAQIELVGTSTTLYDSLEAPVGSSIVPPFTRWDDERQLGIIERDEDGQMIPPSREVAREHLRRILLRVRGDAVWLDIDRLVDDIFSGEMSMEEARRFYMNAVNLASDASFDPEDIRATADPEVATRRRGYEGDPLRVGWMKVRPDEPIVIFGDGSKSDDSTALVGCRISDGYTFLIGLWEKPAKRRGIIGWTAPRDEIDARVHEAHGRFKVVAFWFDPSHTKDDEDQTRYWDVLVDAWHQQWGADYLAWAQLSGDRRNSVGWDMTSPARKVDFVRAVGVFTDELESHLFQHDGHPGLVAHLTNCRRNMTDAGLSVGKISRSSQKKVDGAVCAIGARMLRRVVMNKDAEETVKSGAWWAPV